jgi:hypothetical protein
MNIQHVLIDSRYRDFTNYAQATEFNVPYNTLKLTGVPIKHTTYFVELLDLALPVFDAAGVKVPNYKTSPYLTCEFYSQNSKVYRTRFTTNNSSTKFSQSSFYIPMEIFSPSASLEVTGQKFVHLSSPVGHYIDVQFDEELCFRVADHKGNTVTWFNYDPMDATATDLAQVSAMFKFTLPPKTYI